MKERKIFRAVKNIDEELISEAADYMPESKDKGVKGEETVYAAPIKVNKAGKAKGLWQYPAAAAALLAVVGGTVLIVNHYNGIESDLPVATAESDAQTEDALNTSEMEEEALNTTETEEEPDPVYTIVPPAEAKGVVPLKVVVFDEEEGVKYQVIHVNSYPDVPLSVFDEQYFIPMTTLELFEYYDFHEKVSLALENKFTEVTDENTHHGIYKFPDGSVYDINTFTFELTDKKDIGSLADRFTITLSKETTFGLDYFNYYNSQGISPGGGRSQFYNEETDTVFSILRFKETTVLLSGKIDEMIGDGGYKYFEEEINKERCCHMITKLLFDTGCQFLHFYRYHYDEKGWSEKPAVLYDGY